ncbi:zinc finger protein 512-like isoform X5 [Oncorhynchus keta]|uniref:zinc finger protein 512-like isoform X5 n=1 Tax=Oncorhynchus keta TaxID=8018 RepID=UPI00227C85B0|nr:zinc finger protein 512-like isoform X5 [Oncorhynchus keta]
MDDHHHHHHHHHQLHHHTQGSMSPSYVPRKRKASQPKQKSGVPLPAIQRMSDMSVMSMIGAPPKNDDPHAQVTQKMKRTYGRKRYEDLQNVSLGSGVEDSTSETSCCSVVSSSLAVANGELPPPPPPSARLPHRLVAKDCWPNQAPDTGRAQGRSQEPPPPSDFAMKKMRRVEVDNGAPSVTNFPPEVRHTGGHVHSHVQSGHSVGGGHVHSHIHSGHLHGGGHVHSYVQSDHSVGGGHVQSGHSIGGGHVQCNHSIGCGHLQSSYPIGGGLVQSSYSVVGGHVHSSHSIGGVAIQSSHSHPAEPSEEEKSKVFTFTTKKEPPVYPPGSQEERWQLMILGKGRVTCPKCKSVSRKTVEGLKKHMENCRVNPFTCQQCGKQLKSSTGMKYHIMADHNNLPSPDDINGLDDQSMKEKLRKVLKRMGKLKCSKEGCTGSFTSIMGYLYHMKKCGKEESELEKLLLNCQHCGKVYKSKAGLEYHLKSEHAPVPQNVEEDEVKAQREPNPERTPSGRVKRMSAQVAVFHLQEIANDELAKEWPKRKVIGDLVPDDKKLRYARPGLPAFSQEVLRKWKNEVKLQKKVQCPNLGCGSVYTSVSGLKAHLGLCGRGDFEAGKYKCLICKKEFNSESGVKYHINSVHSQDWFAVTSKSKNFKVLKAKTKENSTVDDPIVQHQTLHVFTPVLEPWQDMPIGPPPVVPEPALQANPEAAEGKRRGKGRGKEKDCYDFTGSDHSSSSSSGSSSSDSETEELDGQRHDVDQWALQRPSIIETHPDVAKQHRSNP